MRFVHCNYYSILSDTILDTKCLEKKEEETNTIMKKKNESMHGMHRHQATYEQMKNAYRSKWKQKQSTNM